MKQLIIDIATITVLVPIGSNWLAELHSMLFIYCSSIPSGSVDNLAVKHFRNQETPGK